MIRSILSALGLAIAAGAFFLYTQPAYDNVHVIQAQIDEYNQALDKATELQKLRQSLLSRYNAFDPADLDRLHKLLPDHVDNVRLILDLDNLAAKYGMALQNVVISVPASESSDKTIIGSIGSAKQKYDSLTLRFSTRGTYADFVQFMQDLESSLRIVDIVSLTLAPETSSAALSKAAGTSDEFYRFSITMRTYWLK